MFFEIIPSILRKLLVLKFVVIRRVAKNRKKIIITGIKIKTINKSIYMNIVP